MSGIGNTTWLIKHYMAWHNALHVELHVLLQLLVSLLSKNSHCWLLQNSNAMEQANNTMLCM